MSERITEDEERRIREAYEAADSAEGHAPHWWYVRALFGEIEAVRAERDEAEGAALVHAEDAGMYRARAEAAETERDQAVAEVRRLTGSGPNSAQSPVEALAGKMTALLLVRIVNLEARLRDIAEHFDEELRATQVKVGVDNSPDPTSIDHQLRDHASRLDSIEDHLATAATDLVQRILAAQEPEPRGFLDRLTASPDGPPYTHRVTDTSGPYFTIEDSDAEEGPR